MLSIVSSKFTGDGDEDESDSTDYNAEIAKAKAAKSDGTEFPYTSRDVILYSMSSTSEHFRPTTTKLEIDLGLGCKRTELPFVYEGDDDFRVLPSFGVIPSSFAVPSFELNSIIPNFNPMMLLHGEQYLEIRKFPIPTEATLVSHMGLVDVVDKGKASVVYMGNVIKDKATGDDVFYSESTVFIRGSGGFGGPKKTSDRGNATRSYEAPSRAPDTTVEEKTTEEQAAIYRLSGDYNPLHIE